MTGRFSAWCPKTPAEIRAAVVEQIDQHEEQILEWYDILSRPPITDAGRRFARRIRSLLDHHEGVVHLLYARVAAMDAAAAHPPRRSRT